MFCSSAAALLVGLAAHADESADESEARSCLQTKAWSHYEDGWALRTIVTEPISTGAYVSHKVTFYGGRTYKIEACGSDTARQVDLALYDGAGTVVLRSTMTGKDPIVDFKPGATTSLFVVAQLREAAAATAEVSVGVFYK